MRLRINRGAYSRIGQSVQQQIDDNRQPLEKVFIHRRARLLKTALRLVGNLEDAEDALQDGLLSAFRNLSGFEGRSQLSTWLTRIVVNAALMQLRRRRPEPMISIHEQFGRDDEPLAGSLPDRGPSPEEIFAQQERLQVVARFLQDMPASYREAVWLRDVQGLSCKEVAKVLGIPVGSVKSSLHRGRRWLRKEAKRNRTFERGQQRRNLDATMGRQALSGSLVDTVAQPAA